MNDYKKILFRALVPYQVHQPGIHSIIHGYLDVIGTDAIKDEYIRRLEKAYDIQKLTRIIDPDVWVTAPTTAARNYLLPFDEQDHRSRFAVYDQEPGFEGKAIWVYYRTMSDCYTPPFYAKMPHWIHQETLIAAIRTYFPDAVEMNVDLVWSPVPVFDPKDQMTIFLQARNDMSEWDAFHERGMKPNLIKPPTRLQRYKQQFREWQLEPVEGNWMYILFVLASIIYVICALGVRFDILSQYCRYVVYIDCGFLLLYSFWMSYKQNHDGQNPWVRFVRLMSRPYTVLLFGIGIEIVRFRYYEL